MGNAPSLTIRFKMEDFPLAMPPVSPIRYGPVELSYVVRQRKPCNRIINMPYRGKKTSIHNEACDSNQVIIYKCFPPLEVGTSCIRITLGGSLQNTGVHACKVNV